MCVNAHRIATCTAVSQLLGGAHVFVTPRALGNETAGLKEIILAAGGKACVAHFYFPTSLSSPRIVHLIYDMAE